MKMVKDTLSKNSGLSSFHRGRVRYVRGFAAYPALLNF